MDQQFCQSCGMPMTEKDYGSEADSGKSPDYCHYCYAEGKFTSESTMEEMIEQCIPFVVGSVYQDADQARKAMGEFYPRLKRWAKA